MNKPEGGIRTAPHKCSDDYVMGVQLYRYGASWLHAGGDINDVNGFMLWMMNIPFKDENGAVQYISQDDAEDAYHMMDCGKFELEQNAKKFLKDYWDAKEQKLKVDF